MAYTTSISDDQIFTALRAFLIVAVGSGVEVVQAIDNRVPPPKDQFINMALLFKTQLTTDQIDFTNTPAVGAVPAVQTETLTPSTKYAFQIDCYGPNAGDQAQAITMAWRSNVATDFFRPYNIAPLFFDDPKRSPVVNGELQYEMRWIITLHLQANPSITVPCEFADEVNIDTINVTAVYPA